MSILSGIGQEPPVFGGGGGSFNPILLTGLQNTSNNGQLGGYVFNDVLSLQASTKYLVVLNIALTGSVDFTDVSLLIQFISPTSPSFVDVVALIPDFTSIPQPGFISISYILNIDNIHTNLDYISINGDYTPNTTTLEYDGNYVAFIQLDNF